MAAKDLNVSYLITPSCCPKTLQSDWKPAWAVARGSFPAQMAAWAAFSTWSLWCALA
jgi:hypothetical protein